MSLLTVSERVASLLSLGNKMGLVTALFIVYIAHAPLVRNKKGVMTSLIPGLLAHIPCFFAGDAGMPGNRYLV